MRPQFHSAPVVGWIDDPHGFHDRDREVENARPHPLERAG